MEKVVPDVKPKKVTEKAIEQIFTLKFIFLRNKLGNPEHFKNAEAVNDAIKEIKETKPPHNLFSYKIIDPTLIKLETPNANIYDSIRDGKLSERRIKLKNPYKKNTEVRIIFHPNGNIKKYCVLQNNTLRKLDEFHENGKLALSCNEDHKGRTRMLDEFDINGKFTKRTFYDISGNKSGSLHR